MELHLGKMTCTQEQRLSSVACTTVKQEGLHPGRLWLATGPAERNLPQLTTFLPAVRTSMAS